MWKIIEAYDQLNAWIRASEGQFIELDNGESYRFMRKRTFSGQELEEFENRLGFELPAEYRRFLIGVGAAELFVGPLSGGIEVLGPDEIQDFSGKVLEGHEAELYPELLLAVSVPKFGGFGGFRPREEREKRYGVFYAEVPPERWLKECDFGAFDEWVVQVVESRAKTV